MKTRLIRSFIITKNKIAFNKRLSHYKKNRNAFNKKLSHHTQKKIKKNQIREKIKHGVTSLHVREAIFFPLFLNKTRSLLSQENCRLRVNAKESVQDLYLSKTF